MFTTATDVEQSSKLPEPETSPIGNTANVSMTSNSDERSTWEFTEPHLIQSKRKVIISALSAANSVTLINKSVSPFWDADHKFRAACTISKLYTKKGAYRYWYAYHPAWDVFLADGREAFFVLGCMDAEYAFAIPFNVLHPLLSALNTTTLDSGKLYWHIHLVDVDGHIELALPKQGRNLELDSYKLAL